LGEEHPDTLVSMSDLASTLWNRGDHAGAQELQEQVVESMPRQLGVEHPWTTIAASGLLRSYLALRDPVSGNRVVRETLLWLLERNPDSLAGQQRQIRASIERLIELLSPNDEADDPGEH
jgi:hypothetical protein